jgi:hypothetical protein
MGIFFFSPLKKIKSIMQMTSHFQEVEQSKLLVCTDDALQVEEDDNVDVSIADQVESTPNLFQKSPKSQAIELKEMRMERSSVESRIMEIEKQLDVLKNNFEETANQKEWLEQYGKEASDLEDSLQALIFKKSNLDYRVQSFSESAENSASIFEAEQVDLASKVTRQIERITISAKVNGKKIRRTIKPVPLYSDLVSQVETLFASRIISLENEDGDTIGSQDELLFAYKDVSANNQSMLKLFAQVIPVKKRSLVSEDDEQKANSNTRKSGRWEFSEVLLYQDGLKLFGEGSWSLIANHVGWELEIASR